MAEHTASEVIHTGHAVSRAYRAEDLQSLVQLISAAGAWPPGSQPTVEQLLWRWKRRGVEPERHVTLIEDATGSLIAFWQAAPFRDASGRLGFDIAVHPAARGRGLGSAILSQIEAEASRTGSARLTCPVYVTADGTVPLGANFLMNRGYRTSHGYWQMRLDNIISYARTAMPEGYSVRTMACQDQDIDTWCKLVMEAFGEETTRAAVLAQMEEPGALPNGYFLAIENATESEVGTSRARIDNVGAEKLGYIGTVGVLAQHRRRGIAEGLVRHTLEYLSGMGVESATLFVERQNASARRIYDAMGWRPVYCTNHYWKAVDHSYQSTAHGS